MNQPPRTQPDVGLGTGSDMIPAERIHWRRLLQRRLLIRVTVPTLIGLVQLAIAVGDLAAGRASAGVLWWALPALVVGYLFGRVTHIAWQGAGSQVALVGGQVLLSLAYILVRLGSHAALRHTLAGQADTAVVLLVVSVGLFLGRSLGLAGQIRRALTSVR